MLTVPFSTNAIPRTLIDNIEARRAVSHPLPSADLEWESRKSRNGGICCDLPDGRHNGQAIAATRPSVEISPSDAVRRRAIAWPGIAVELIQSTGHCKIEY